MATEETHVQQDIMRAGKEIRDRDKVNLVNGWRKAALIIGGVLLVIWFLVMYNYNWGRSDNNSNNDSGEGTMQTTPAPIVPVYIDPLCRDGMGGSLPECEVRTLTAQKIEVFIRSGYCVLDNPAGSANFAQQGDSQYFDLWSKSGQSVKIGMFFLKPGEVAFKGDAERFCR